MGIAQAIPSVLQNSGIIGQASYLPEAKRRERKSKNQKSVVINANVKKLP